MSSDDLGGVSEAGGSGKGRRARALQIAAAALTAVVIAAGAFVVGQSTASEEASSVTTAPGEFDFSVLNDIRDILGKDYVKLDNLDDQTLYEGAIQGLLNILNDSGTFYIDRTSYELDTTLTGSYEGIGANIALQNNETVIVAPIKDTPADRAGLVSGDVIVAVEGELTKGWALERVTLRVRGPRGSEVTISIRHVDDTIEDYTLTRARVQTESVTIIPPGGTLRDASGADVTGLGYVYIRSFTPDTAAELEAALREVIAAGAKGLILDVRGNPGGSLNATVSSIDLFLDDGTMLIQRDASGRETNYVARAGQVAADLPVVILQDRFSASASEVLAAALQENGRATVVGETSFGKGTVNSPRQLRDGGALFVTIAQWLTPSGTLIDKVGVRPDVEVLLTDEDIDLRRDAQLHRAIDILQGQLRAP